jgi:membrane protein implicated in regulation of membrane protease activity
VFLILALILLFVLPWPESLVGFVLGLVLFLGELAFWHRRVRGLPRVVGCRKLIGSTGIVMTACRPEGQARVDGAIWAARCEGGADVGDTVSVVGLEGLTLIVKRT